MRNARRLLHVAIFAAAAASIVVPATGASAAPAKPTLASLQQQIKDKSTALEKVVEQFNKVTIDLTANQKAVAKIAAQIKPTKQALDTAQGNLASMAAAAYMGGTVNSFTALISSDSASDLLNQLSTIDQVASERKRQIDGVMRLQTTYANEKRTLDGLIASESARHASLTAQRKTITAQLGALYKMRAEAFGSPTVKTGGSHPAPPYVPGRGGKVVSFAYRQLGKPYVWAKAGPGSYDCSGLVLAAYSSVGVSLPHNARAQWGVVHHISKAELSPGDLVFYESLGHVAIYIGGGRVIHAPTFGDVVKISSVTMMSPYGYGRI